MTLKFRLEGNRAATSIRTRAERRAGQVADAARLAMNEANRRILEAGRQDIQSGGNFGPRWTTGLQGRVTPEGVRTSNLTLAITQAVPYWRVFEYGAKILGRPLLWIPLPWNPTKVRAREFPGKLFRVNRRGKNPLLMTGKPARAMYVGVKSVRLRRRFHLRQIIKRVSKQMPFLFRKAKRLAGLR